MKRSKSKGDVAKTDKAANNNNSTALRKVVHGALHSRAKGAQSSAYNNFVKELQSLRRKLETSPDAAAEFSLIALIQALTTCVSSLKEGMHDAVLTIILSISLWSCTKAVRGAVLDLVVELVVSSSTFIPNCMQVLIFNLLPPPGSPPLQPDERGTAWSPPPLAVEVQAQVVDAMERAIQLVPALPTRLLPMLVQNIPHKLRDRSSQCLFLRAVILLAEGKVGSSLREGLLLGVVEHLLSIDADIKWQEIVDAPTGYDHEEGSSDEEQDDIFELEGMTSELDISDVATASALQQQMHEQQLAALQDGFHDPAAFAAATQQGHSLRRLQQQLAAAANGGSSSGAKRPPVDETADKLDSLMEMTFTHLQWRVDSGQLGAAWQTMLTAFERTLLHAHRCKFTQYLIFFLALKDPVRCCSSFSACLVSLLRDARQPPITRSACAAYLASFLARCALAPKELVVDVMRKLACCCQEYADSVMQQGLGRGLCGRSSRDGAVLLCSGSSSSGAGAAAGPLAQVQRHQAFYAMVQALLYVLCYHMQPLLGPQPQQQRQCQQPGTQQQLAAGVEQLVRQQVLPLLAHPLAPLAVCHQAVTHEFVRQALLLGLADDSWEAAAVEAVAAHQAAAAAATAAAAAVVIGGDGGADVGGHVRGVLRPLEVFFPFDPYLLQRSSRFLELGRSYMCFSHGQPHAAGDASGQQEISPAGEADSDGSSSGSGSDSEEEGEEAPLLCAAAAAAAAAGTLPQGAAHASEALSDDEGDSSSSGSEDEADEPAAAAAGAAAISSRGRQRSGVVPVGFAAAAARGQADLGLSGPSPPADMMATSLVAAPYLGRMAMGGISFSPGEAEQSGASPYGVSPGMAMPMSYTYDGSYMQNLPARS
ncbi:RNA polymerase I-specific transcription initiation factor RRN3-domain-containing protein [Scenedesmus sp. NREL 46B-D3]|nr:RNA polymerase I-specific transcription initiation factor RRN3-domain-containing protein [Scenedesmus sp. NREL 46B-D3]